MRLLTDSPEAARAFSAAGATWRPLVDGALDPRLQRAWRVLAGPAAAWLADDGPVAPDNRVPRALLVLGRAEGSQFEALRSALRDGDGLPDALASLALTGSGFRGQRGRAWAALPGNLHLCVLERIDRPAAALQAALTALPAVATARAIERLSEGRVRPGVKWVNDLLVAGAKVAGVLTATQVQGARVTHALFGIGVNVARAPELAADARAPRPGCLADAAPDLGEALPALTRGILDEVDLALSSLRAGDAAAVVAAYRERATFVGRRVAIWSVTDHDRAAGTPLARGRVTALLDDLALRLEGHPEPIRSGRMTLLDDDPTLDAEDGRP
jgi:biotin-(acetyl-CoA carboxylase) ligase